MCTISPACSPPKVKQAQFSVRLEACLLNTQTSFETSKDCEAVFASLVMLASGQMSGKDDCEQAASQRLHARLLRVALTALSCNTGAGQVRQRQKNVDSPQHVKFEMV